MSATSTRTVGRRLAERSNLVLHFASQPSTISATTQDPSRVEGRDPLAPN
jgi:hypothetical protein